MNYTDEQRDAINTVNGNLQLIACAGSGKTQVISARIVELLKQPEVAPPQIVAFTFTEKAAAELKARIYRLHEEAFGHVHGLGDMFVGTIHAFALELLQTELQQFLKYRVLNEVETRLLVDRNSNKSGLTTVALLKGGHLQRYKDSRLFVSLMAMIRESDFHPDRLINPSVLEARAKYEALLDEHRYLDYSGILRQAVDALDTDEALRQHVGARVRYLTVDEYQDTNPLQERLIRILHDLGAQVCVVGDDDQTIYQWNGSDPANMLGFCERYPGARSGEPLAANFRSSRSVVDLARRLVEANPSRLKKQMRAGGHQQADSGDAAMLKFDAQEDQAAFIADQIEALMGTPFKDEEESPDRGLSYSDVAILFRSVKRAGPVLEELERRQIPFVIVGMNRLFETPEARAARGIFLYMNGDIGQQDLRQLWTDADLGIPTGKLNAAIGQLDAQRADWGNDRYAVYNIQRTYLAFLEAIGITEDMVPQPERGERVLYNLGKFSQVISDFENINFHSEPAEKYRSFAGFLTFEAENYYPEGWEDAAIVRPDAVQVMTIHQAKGREWPVVFVPTLTRSLFPIKAPGGRNVWHVINPEAVEGAARYHGGEVEERRLLYVALTRSKKYLYCSWAPWPTPKRSWAKPSPFVDEIRSAGGDTLAYRVVDVRRPAKQLPRQPAHQTLGVALTFSDLRYYFECPYSFKLRILYGFNPPIAEALGYGKSLHDALAEVHARALRGDFVSPDEAAAVIGRHLHVPFAYPSLRADLEGAATAALTQYLTNHKDDLKHIEHFEKRVEIDFGDGVTVDGRIDLIRRSDTSELVVIDFKSTERAQVEDLTWDQLHLYSLGYWQLTEEMPKRIEILNLDRDRVATQQVTHELLDGTSKLVRDGAAALRKNHLPRINEPEVCGSCDVRTICHPAIPA